MDKKHGKENNNLDHNKPSTVDGNDPNYSSEKGRKLNFMERKRFVQYAE